MLQISLTDLKANAGKYVAMVGEQDVFITKNGKLVAKLVPPTRNKVEIAKSLFGILPQDSDPDEAKKERFEA